jgi:protein-S-isoprenylcysteine O-methyltransferase Ste14
MIAWINFLLMILTVLFCGYFYIKSVSPAVLEKKIGENAYKKCALYRTISGIFFISFFVTWVVYFYFPLPIPIPRFFPWERWLSGLIALAIAVPSGYVFFLGIKDAGKETMEPKKQHKMYGGIYQKIRHPQMLGEIPFTWVIAFLLHSPFLALFSFVSIPLFYFMARAEEKDLVIRYGQKYIEYKKRTGFFIPKKG